MRFPLALTTKIAAYIVGHKLRGTKKFATVLQLEPLHTCNLTCTGCGRIREYSTSLKDMLPLEDCLSAAQECNAPMVSICGGEPLIYPKIEAIVEGLHDRAASFTSAPTPCSCAKKCANGWRREYPKRPTEMEQKISRADQRRVDDARRKRARSSRDRKMRRSRRSGRANGCIGMSISTVWRGRMI